MEALAVLFCLTVLVGMLLPSLSGSRKSPVVRCLGNLKQVGLAAMVFTLDHEGRFPFQVPVQEEGSLGLNWDAWLHFRPLSNDLHYPGLLACRTEPRGRYRLVASNWSSPRSGMVSYFINLDARANDPRGILFGDRHLATNGYALRPGLTMIHSNSVIHWTRELHQVALTDFTHGNLVFSDGHAEGYRSPRLISKLLHELTKPTRLLAP